MRQIAWVFIILSPLIALTQSYMTTPAIAATGTHRGRVPHRLAAAARLRRDSLRAAVPRLAARDLVCVDGRRRLASGLVSETRQSALGLWLGRFVVGAVVLGFWEFTSGRWYNDFWVSRPSAIAARVAPSYTPLIGSPCGNRPTT